MANNRKNRLVSVSALISVICLLGVAGCNKKQEAAHVAPTAPVPSQQKPAQVQKPMTTAKIPAVVQKQMSSIKVGVKQAAIDFTGKKDPFKPAIVELTPVAKDGQKPIQQRANLLPIQRFDVEKFKITGIIAGLKENRALLVDPEGRAYVARTGMLIGPNNGRIIRITSNSVEVDESFRDDAGRIKKRTVKLALQRKR